MAGPGGTEAGRVSVRVLPDTVDFRPALRAFLDRVAAREVLRIRTEADTDGLARDVLRGIRAAEASAKQIQLNTTADTDGLIRDVRTAAKAAEKSAAIRLPVSAAVGALGKLGPIVQQGATLLAAISAASSLLHALAPVAGSLAALPALFAGAAAAAVTLKLGLSGVSDALGGDAEALARLTPAARGFVGQVDALRPAFDGLRRSVQENLFAGLAGQLREVADVWLPRLQVRLPAVAGGFNDIARGLAAGATSGGFLAGVDAALANTGTGLSGLAKGAAPLLDGIGRVIGAFAPALSAAGAAAGGLATRFGEFIARAEATGQLASFVESVKTALSALGGILQNVGSILVSILSATSTSGGGLLANIEAITGAVSAFLSSAEGQNALTTLFESAHAVVSALLPVVITLAEGIGSVLAPAIASIASALGPALEVLAGALVEAVSSIDIEPLAQGLAAVLTAVAPLLPVVGKLAGILAGALGSALSGLAAGLVPVAEAIAGAFTPETLDAIAGAFGTLGAAVGQIASQAAPLLTEALSTLLPPLLALLPTLLDGLIPAWLALVEAQLALLSAVLPLLPPIVALIEAIAPLITLVAQLAAVLVTALAEGALVPLIELVVELASWLIEGLAVGIEAAVSWLSSLGEWFGNLGGMIGDAVDAILGYWSAAYDFWRALPGKVIGFLKGLPDRLVSLGQDMVRGMLRGLRNLGGQIADLLLDFASAAWDAVTDFFGINSPSRLFMSLGENIGAGWLKGLEGIESPIVRQSVRVAGAAYEPWTADIDTPDAVRGYAPKVAGSAAPVVTVDGTGLPRALAEWLRYAVRTQGGGNVQNAFGSREVGYAVS